MNGVQLREIREGLARLLVPDIPRGRGPGKDTGLPFYNPTMEKNRDMTVLLMRALGRQNVTFLDGMSATGALGIRVALEARGTKVTCNDQSKIASELIHKNAEMNGVELESVFNDRFQAHLARTSYEFIDIDPFGSPAPYLDVAFQAVPRDGVVGFTATDTAVLCGAQTKACIRHYEARPLHIDCCKEVGLRILVGCCARVAAKYDKSIVPLISFSTDHYMRAIMAVGSGAKKADETLSRMGHVAYDAETGERLLLRGQPPDQLSAGPLWADALLDGDTVAHLKPLHHMRHETSQLIGLLKAEVGAPGLFYDTDYLSRKLRVSPPRISALIDALHKAGFVAVRTHFSPEGIKTDAALDELVEVYKGV